MANPKSFSCGRGYYRPGEALIRFAHHGVFVVGVIWIAVGLHLWGDPEFRNDGFGIVYLTFLGLFGLRLAERAVFPWLGLSYRDDAVERRNPASLAGFCGAVLGAAAIYAGGNIGEGPSYMENVFSIALAGGVWLSLWAILELGESPAISVAEERDLGAGLRLGGYLPGSGLVLARAVAGDWHSVTATIRDLVRDGYFAPLLCAVALFVEKLARPSRRQPFPPWLSYGLLPAVIYVAASVTWLWHLGPWEGYLR